MKKTLATILVLFLALPIRADEAVTEPITVPFKLLPTNHIVVQVKINDNGPYRLIFDTGAPITLVNTRTAKKSGILGKAPRMPSLFGPVSQTSIKNLQLGDLKASSVPVIVMDHPTVELVSRLLGPIEGIVGFPFFARYSMTLDYQAKEMTFTPSGYKPGDIMETLLASLMDREKPPAKVLASAGLWGLKVEKKAGDEQAGIEVAKVLPGSAAEKAGLRAGDRVLTLDDYWTDTVEDCYNAVAHAAPGSEVTVKVKRGDADITVKVKPERGL
jgi:hypothetical protein